MIKRAFDTLFSAILLILLSPLLIVIAIFIELKLGTPVFFRQNRPGRNEKIFSIYKFRTMTSETDENGKLLPDEKRLTPFGQFLRKTSFDELPQLLNVLKGDMSFVGPRPLLVEYLALYNEQQKRRHQIKPGITGWAQVNGRNGLSWNKRFEYNVWYVDNQSFWLDMKILWMTVKIVLKREGISSTENVTMEKFKGGQP